MAQAFPEVYRKIRKSVAFMALRRGVMKLAKARLAESAGGTKAAGALTKTLVRVGEQADGTQADDLRFGESQTQVRV